MIKSFKDKETEKLFHGEFSAKIPQNIHIRSLKKLDLIHSAESVQELYVLPGNRLEYLKGKRQNQYSIRINDQWRICFKWIENNAYEVEIIDYH